MTATLTLVALAIGAVAGWWVAGRRARSSPELTETRSELTKRLNDLFSLQELTYVLSESIRVDRIAEQLARYVTRFISPDGALVVLEGSSPDKVTVSAAAGRLEPLTGKHLPIQHLGDLIRRAMETERLAVATVDDDAPPCLAELDVTLHCTAAAPLHAHGIVLGAVVVAGERRGSELGEESLRLLSSVATHGALALSNARFFQLVHRAKEEWETTFDAISDGIALVDALGHVRRANGGLATLLRRPLEEVLGVDLAAALTGRAGDLFPAIGESGDAARPQPRTVRSEPLKRTFRLTASPLGEAFGEGWRVILVEDVTDEKVLEARLIQSDKMASMGQLVSGVAHELNNPLTSVVGLSEFLLEQMDPEDRRYEHIKIIFDQADRAARIVRNLLTFARQGPSERADVDLNDVTRRTTDLIAYDLGVRQIDLEVSLHDALPAVRGDRYQLQQVVLNLLTNAVQAVAELPSGAPRMVRVTTSHRDGTVTVKVEDSGSGIPEDILPKIFDPFVTTKSSGGGTGLGLSISYRLVEGHGGHLRAERLPAGGSSFVVELPAVDPLHPPVRRRSAEWSEVPAAVASVSRRVLLVDADPGVRRTIGTLFTSEGHQVETAGDADDALRRLQTGAYDLVIADARGALSSGESFVSSYFAADPSAGNRTILLTADVREETETWLRQLGVPFFRKPFRVRELRAAARGILEGVGS